MLEGLIAALFQVALALLDKKADEAIGRLPAPVRSEVGAIKDHLIASLAGPLGEHIAREIVAPAMKKALAKRFPNDPSTWTWA